MGLARPSVSPQLVIPFSSRFFLHLAAKGSRSYEFQVLTACKKKGSLHPFASMLNLWKPLVAKGQFYPIEQLLRSLLRKRPSLKHRRQHPLQKRSLSAPAVLNISWGIWLIERATARSSHGTILCTSLLPAHAAQLPCIARTTRGRYFLF